MFADRTDGSLRARQDLAVAVNAAMALTPRWIEVTTAGEDKRGREGHDASGQGRRHRGTRGPPARHLRSRQGEVSRRLFLRFVARLRGRFPRRRCSRPRAVTRSGRSGSTRPRVVRDGARRGLGPGTGQDGARARDRGLLPDRRDWRSSSCSPTASSWPRIHSRAFPAASWRWPTARPSSATCPRGRRAGRCYFAMLNALGGARDDALLGLCRDVGWQIAGSATSSKTTKTKSTTRTMTKKARPSRRSRPRSRPRLSHGSRTPASGGPGWRGCSSRRSSAAFAITRARARRAARCPVRDPAVDHDSPAST